MPALPDPAGLLVEPPLRRPRPTRGSGPASRRRPAPVARGAARAACPRRSGTGAGHGSSMPGGCITGSMSDDIEDRPAPSGTALRDHRAVRRGTAHRPQQRGIGSCAELGYTDVWSAETDGTDGLTPLALAAAWEPELQLGRGHHPGVHPGARPAGPERGRPGRGGPRTLHLRPRDLVRRDRLAVERRSSSPSPTSGCGTPSRSSGRPWPARRSTTSTTPSRPGVPAGPTGGAASTDLPGRPAPRHAAPGRPGGRRGDHQLAVGRGRGHGGARDRGGPPGGRPDLRVSLGGRRPGPDGRAPDDRRLPERRRLRRVPPLAGPGPRPRADVGGLAGRRPQAGAGGHPRRGGGRPAGARLVRGVPAHLARYVANGVDIPVLAVLPIGVSLAEAVKGLAPPWTD